MTTPAQRQTSRILWDARQAPDTLPAIPANTELQLQTAGRIALAHAPGWRQKHPKPALLTAVLDLPDAARLDLTAWLAALEPDVVELRTPAWTATGMEAIGWPAGAEILTRVLTALLAAGQKTQVVLHVSDLTLAELALPPIDALAFDVGAEKLELVLRPVLGAHAPRLDALVVAVTALTLGGHAVQASRLWPACALPTSIDGLVAFQSELASARVTFLDACGACPARAQGRCTGMAADLLAATTDAGASWAGWATWAAEREPPEEGDDPTGDEPSAEAPAVDTPAT